MNRLTHTRSQVGNGQTWGAELRREFDILARATQGVGVASLFHIICSESILVDDGTLTTTTGEQGHAWNPAVYLKKTPKDPVGARVKACGASLGRVLCGGHPDYRAYLAFMEAIYRVTAQQDFDVTARIEKLWDELEDAEDIEVVVQAKRKPGLLKRLWSAIRDWWKSSYDPEMEQR